jgi:hypothetical protein
MNYLLRLLPVNHSPDNLRVSSGLLPEPLELFECDPKGYLHHLLAVKRRSTGGFLLFSHSTPRQSKLGADLGIGSCISSLPAWGWLRCICTSYEFPLLRRILLRIAGGRFALRSFRFSYFDFLKGRRGLYSEGFCSGLGIRRPFLFLREAGVFRSSGVLPILCPVSLVCFLFLFLIYSISRYILMSIDNSISNLILIFERRSNVSRTH